ncbi:MAG: acyl carrier protein [Alphaproteobacteria bacterium]|nr:acyl carrier protein [Alphaproteobacteria bacterium]MCB9696243.1 acyl carrier protein [Alphaproteobacteria bacterium]
MSEEQRVIALVERALQADPGSLRGTTRFADLEGWDSMGMVDFLGSLYDESGVALSIDDLLACSTIGEVAARVEAAR